MGASETLRGPQHPQLTGAVDTMSLRDQIVSLLREAVLSGELKQGWLYSARALAAQLGVSLTPVRGAVLQLVQAGVMEQCRNRGFRVCSYSAADRTHLAELLLLLEGEAIGAFAMSSSRTLRILERSTTAGLAAARAGDVHAFLRCEEEFHHALCLGTGSPTLVQTAFDLRCRMRLHALAQRSSAQALTARAMEHRLLLHLMRRRQVEQARLVLERHLRGREQAGALGA